MSNHLNTYHLNVSEKRNQMEKICKLSYIITHCLLNNARKSPLKQNKKDLGYGDIQNNRRRNSLSLDMCEKKRKLI